MRLDLENHVVLIIERDDPCIVLKDADAPIVGSKILSNLLGRSEDRLFEHAGELPCSMLVSVLDPSPEGLVAAMLAPSLCDGLELDVRRLFAQFPVVALNCLHFRQRKVQLPRFAQLHKLGVAQAIDRHLGHLQLIRRSDRELVELQGTVDHLLDRIVR